MGTIVVGIDGSQFAEASLEFAAEEATLRGAGLRIVIVRDVSERALKGPRPVPEVFEAPQRIAEHIVQDAVARVKELWPQLDCEGVVLFGEPELVLVEEAKHAVLVVVGRRGLGGVASLLLGSVSRYVVNHAPCPVVVVPPVLG